MGVWRGLRLWIWRWWFDCEGVVGGVGWEGGKEGRGRFKSRGKAKVMGMCDV